MFYGTISRLPEFPPVITAKSCVGRNDIRYRWLRSLNGGRNMNNRTIFNFGALVSALALATAVVAAPAFAEETAVHHHHHHLRHTVSAPQMPAQPQPCIHMQTSCL